MAVRYTLALDFGGTKLAAALVDLQAGVSHSISRCPTPQKAEASLTAMMQMVNSLIGELASSELSGIGVSFGGPVELDGRTVRTSHHVPGWEGFALADRLEETWKVPVRVANDADAAALGEFHFGAGRGYKNLLYLTVSTGIGGGVILNGELYRGERGWAGEIGHMVLQPGGPPCPCGRRGCLEALASGRSIARRMAERLASGEPSSLAGREISAKFVAEAAAASDPLAMEVWGDAMRWLGTGIASAANLLNPGCVVVGGGLVRAGNLLVEPVRETVQRLVLDPELRIEPAALGDQAELLGAAALFLSGITTPRRT
jgi:glucokinase